ncbi:MAG: hypothetical protein M3478_13575 [Planctomycetota bacterium]|nr:hypothetical protein [Planctomycetota bacterium]
MSRQRPPSAADDAGERLGPLRDGFQSGIDRIAQLVAKPRALVFVPQNWIQQIEAGAEVAARAEPSSLALALARRRPAFGGARRTLTPMLFQRPIDVRLDDVPRDHIIGVRFVVPDALAQYAAVFLADLNPFLLLRDGVSKVLYEPDPFIGRQRLRLGQNGFRSHGVTPAEIAPRDLL